MDKQEIKKKIRQFTDLIAWKEGHTLVLLIYAYTSTFPRQELFSLTDQMRRAAVSITSNIAEGFGRQTLKEKIQFYYHAQGSISEVKNQLIIAKDLGYLKEKDYEKIYNQANQAHRLLQGLITKTKSFLNLKS